MNISRRSMAGHRAQGIASPLFKRNRADGECDRLRYSRRRGLLLGAPLLAAMMLACALCVGTAGWQDSDGAVGQEFNDGTLWYKIMKEDPNEVCVSGLVDSATASIKIPDTVEHEGQDYTITSIGGNAFLKCENLSSVSFDTDSLSAISDGAFNGCASLRGIQIPDTVASIGNKAFASSGLTSIDIPSGVTQIAQNTFNGCSGLGSVTFKGQVESIGGNAFYGCTSLTEIQIPDTVASIGSLAFYSSGLRSIDIPSGVTQIEQKTFAECSGLSSVTFQGQVESIGDQAFENCTSLTEIQIPNTVASIEWKAFNGCSGLQSIRFGKGIETIDSTAFSQTFYDETSTKEFDPTKDASELQGRLFKDDGTGSSKMIRQVQYKLAFDCGDGVTKEVMYNAGDRIAKPDDPERTGYSFMYWAKDDKEFDFANAVMPAEDMTLTAVWEANQYTISFDPDGGTAVDPITQDYGTLVEKPADPTKEGYSFLYWAKDGKEYAFGTMPAEDVVLTAVWEAHVFTVTFVTGTGTEIAYERAYGSSMTLPGEESGISKAGYSLSGWQISGQGDVYVPGTEFVVTSDVTFTAVWKAVPAWDDDDPYVPVPDSDTGSKSSDAGTGASVAAVAIAAGCAAALLIMLAMLGNGRSRS